MRCLPSCISSFPGKGDLRKTPLFVQLLRQGIILILEMTGVCSAGGLKFFPSLNLNPPEAETFYKGLMGIH